MEKGRNFCSEVRLPYGIGGDCFNRIDKNRKLIYTVLVHFICYFNTLSLTITMCICNSVSFERCAKWSV